MPLVRSIGWRVLGENCGREIVVGAVAQPWEADVTFHGLNPDAFAAFTEPGYVKIAWSLRADPLIHDARARFGCFVIPVRASDISSRAI